MANNVGQGGRGGHTLIVMVGEYYRGHRKERGLKNTPFILLICCDCGFTVWSTDLYLLHHSTVTVTNNPGTLAEEKNWQDGGLTFSL